MRNTAHSAAAIGLALAVGVGSVAGADAVPVVLTGDAAPGAGGRLFDDLFRRPVVNGSGEIAFVAQLADGKDGAWHTSGGLGVQPALAIESDAAPGGGTFASLSTSSMRINDSGHAAFMIRVGSADGYWSNRTGSTALIVQEGQSAPGSSPPSNFATLNGTRFHLNNSGHIAFNDSGLDGVWSESTGSIQLVAGAGNLGPGGITISNVPRLSYNDNGHSAFVADDSTTNSNYILSDRSGSLQKVIGAGDTDPDGEMFFVGGNPMGEMRFNNSGQIAFQANVGTGNVRGIYVEDAGGTLQVVAKQGVALPDGTIPGTTTAISLLALDDQGKLFYQGGSAAGTGNLYVYDTNTNVNSLLIAAGTSAPGTGAAFDSFRDAIKTNAGGRLAFRAEMDDGNAGFWIEQTPGAGDYQLIAAEGQLVEVAPGDFRTIDVLDLHDTQFFNDSGHYAYQVDFVDDTEAIFVGVFVATPAPVPVLPAFWVPVLSLLLATAGVVILSRRAAVPAGGG